MINHRHTMYARNYLYTKYIGRLKMDRFNPFINIQDIVDPRVTHINDQPIEKLREFQQQTFFRPMVWTLNGKYEESKHINRLEFHSFHFVLSNYLKGIRKFGRHLLIQPYGNALFVSKRPYSVIICMSKENLEYLDRLTVYTNTQTNYKIFKVEGKLSTLEPCEQYSQ